MLATLVAAKVESWERQSALVFLTLNEQLQSGYCFNIFSGNNGFFFPSK